MQARNCSAVMALSAGAQRAMRVAWLLAVLVLAGLFVGALFSGPSPYKDALRGHVDRAKLIATDDAARAEAIEYFSGRMSLINVIMADIRRAQMRLRCACSAGGSAQQVGSGTASLSTNTRCVRLTRSA